MRRRVWEGAFLAALEAGGSVTAAARAAGVDKSSAYYARKADAAFAARWEAALAAGRGRLARGDPPALKRDEIVRGSRHGRPCVMRVGPGRWSAASEARFLAVLAETANVRAAAEAVGMSNCAVYQRRARFPAFAAAWAAALTTGYADVELLLIKNAKDVLGDAPAPRRRGRLKEDMTVADALNLLRLHRASVKGGAPQRYAWRAQEPDIEEVRAEVLRRVAAMEGRG